MSEVNNDKVTFCLCSTLAGGISFFTGVVITFAVLSSFDFSILDIISAGGVGSFFLGFFLMKRLKIFKMVLAGLIAVPVGFVSAFLLAGGVDLLISFMGVNVANSIINCIGNIIGIMFMGIVCGAIFGASIYGRKSVWMFSTVCGMVSFFFGILVSFFNSGHEIKGVFENVFTVFGHIDLNFLAIITSFGLGTGLSIGLYSILKQNKSKKELY